jgi:phage-related minor tail protein
MYDGAVKIDTSLDPKGLDESMRKFKQAIEDGASTAQKALSKVDDAVNLTARNSEKLDSSFKVDDESQQEMIKTLDNLNAKIHVQQQQLSNLQDEYKRVASRQGENSDAALKLQKQMLSTESSIDGLIKKSDKMASSISDGAEETSSEIKSTGNVFTSVFDAAGLHATESIDEVLKAFEGMNSGMGSSTAAASSAMGGISVAAAAVGTAAGAAAIQIETEMFKISEVAREAADEVEFQADRIKVALGLTDKETESAKNSINSIFKEGLVDNRDDAEEALTAVMRLMEAQGEEAEGLANKIIGIKVAFGEDFASTARTAATLMQTFGISGEEALDIITAGLQTSANKNGDLLDVLNEYSPAFNRMGLDGEEMLSKIISATDAGAFSADKAADAFKEFYNRAAGADTNFLDALNELGVNGEDAMKKITSGGEIAKAEFEYISDKLSKVTSESKQAQIASQLFGSQWEDVGTDAVLALGDVDSAIVNTSGTAAKAYKDLVNNDKVTTQALKNDWGETFKQISGVLADVFLVMSTGIFGIGKALFDSGALTSLFKSNKKGYATGTASASPGWHLLGENGPEWGYFRGGEVVKTAAQSMAMANSAMAGSAAFPMTSITNYNIRVDDIDTFNAIVNRVKYEQQYERMGYSGR